MMIVPTSYKLTAISVMLVFALTTAYFVGYNKAAEKYIAEKEVIVAQLNVLQKKATEDKQRWEKENEEATKKHSTDVAILRNRIKRLLLPVSSQVPTATITNCSCTSNGSPSEWSSSGFSLEGCALDALQVIEWQQWARDKGIQAD